MVKIHCCHRLARLLASSGWSSSSGSGFWISHRASVLCKHGGAQYLGEVARRVDYLHCCCSDFSCFPFFDFSSWNYKSVTFCIMARQEFPWSTQFSIHIHQEMSILCSLFFRKQFPNCFLSCSFSFLTCGDTDTPMTVMNHTVDASSMVGQQKTSCCVWIAIKIA